MHDELKAWTWCQKLQNDNNYIVVVPLKDGRWVGIVPHIYTTSIATGPLYDNTGMSDRWCYSEPQKAIDALIKWMVDECAGEPTGWHRHPATGRRVDKFGQSYVEP